MKRLVDVEGWHKVLVEGFDRKDRAIVFQGMVLESTSPVFAAGAVGAFADGARVEWGYLIDSMLAPANMRPFFVAALQTDDLVKVVKESGRSLFDLVIGLNVLVDVRRKQRKDGNEIGVLRFASPGEADEIDVRLKAAATRRFEEMRGSARRMSRIEANRQLEKAQIEPRSPYARELDLDEE